MNYIDNARLHLIYQILGQKTLSSRLFVQYMNADRHYNDGDILYMREAHFIMSVGPGDGKTMSELAEDMSVTHGAVSQTASRLEKKGYILRKRDESDRRQILVLLTDKGKEFYKAHLEYDSTQFASMDERTLSRFSEDELRLILEYETLMTRHFAQTVE